MKDFILRGEVTELQIYYNRPPVLDALKYTEFLEKYNTSSKKPKYYEDNPDAENNVDINRHFFKYTWMLLEFNMCIFLSNK